MSKNCRILFIIHDLYQEDNEFPLGAGYMSALLKKDTFEVEVYSQDVFHYSNEELAKYLDSEEFDIIGVGFLAARFKETVEELCCVVNQHKKNAWLVLGGQGPSPIPEYMLEKTNADMVVMGEAEEIIVELANCRKEKGNLSGIKGLCYKIDGRVIINQRHKPVKDIDSIPFPEWSLFPMKNYTTCLRPFGAGDNDIALDILTSRGCINRCNFCYRMESGIRVRSAKNVVAEMLTLNETYGVNYFIMCDELFVLDKNRVVEYKKLLKENGLKIKFSCNARVDLFDEELAVLLKECGCQFLNFGMESSDQEVLDIMNKRTTVEQNIKAAEIAKRTVIGIGLNFIWGNIGDTQDSLKNNVALIKKYNTYNQIRTIRPVTSYPGSDLYYEAIKRGLLSGAEDFFNKFKNSDLITVNFTNIPTDKCYNLLFEANKELIIDHYMHTTKDMSVAQNLINDFHDLYFNGNFKFRGARHYKK
jgi:radical SAM superfamily enzyme YgiQ (UPF0313 family)